MLPALTVGLAAPFTFAYAAIRLRSRILGWSAALYAALSFSSFYLAVAGDGGSSWLSNLGPGLALFTMVTSTVHGLALRPRLLARDAEQKSALDGARRRIQRRTEARRIVASDRLLADELRIGRPDLARRYDDGGLVDVNHVPASVLAEVSGIAPSLAEQIVVTREGIGGFRSLDDLSVTLGIPPDELDHAADTLIFRP